ncbi:SDR family oxidoreductase [Actinomadura kijaniata]|uniref:SDR family oxidoreductase n=1 Tax=Actinomadura kijaniata TaxID=46161 RepID=UPI003F1BF5DD
MSQVSRPVVLVSGVSGVVGGAVARALVPDFDVVALTGRRRVVGYEQVRVDLPARRLGLTARDWAELADRADLVVHAAGKADFTDDPAAMAAVNVEGAARVAELAAAAHAPLIHVSSAYVARLEFVREHEDRIPAECPVRPSVYLASKAAAERDLAAFGGPLCVVRPSVVMGDSADGTTSARQSIHDQIRLVARGTPVMAVGGHVRLDMLPRDVAGQCVAALAAVAVTDPAALPGLFWATAGYAAPTLRATTELVVREMARRGRPVPSPEFFETLKAPLTEFPGWDRLTSLERTVLMCQAANGLMLGDGEPFPSSLGGFPLLGTPAPVRPDEALEHFRNDVEFTLRRR